MRYATYLIYSLLLICISACKEQPVSPVLLHAEACMMEFPDSARLLLFSIPSDKQMKGEALICHEWIKGFLCFDSTQLKEAQHHFLYALKLAEKSGKRYYEGKICIQLARLYCIQDLYPEAERYAERSIQIFEFRKDSVRLASAYRILGAVNCLRSDIHQLNSYYKKACKYAFHSDTALYREIRTEWKLAAKSWSMLEDPELEQLLLSSIPNADSLQLKDLSMGIFLYFQQNSIEARTYLPKIILFPEYYKKVAAYNYLSTMESFEYDLPYTKLYKKENDSIYFAHKRVAAREMQYQYDSLSWENRNLQLQNQNAWKGIMALVCLILSGTLGFIYYSELKKKQRKEQETIQLYEEISLSKRQIEILRQEDIHTGEQSKQLQTLLDNEKKRLEHLNNKLTELHGKYETQAILNDRFRQENRRLKETLANVQFADVELDETDITSLGILLSFHGESFSLRYTALAENNNIPNLLQLIERLYGTSLNLKQFTATELKDKDKLLCYLHLLGVSHARLSLFFDTTPQTLSKYKQRLKVRLGIEELFHVG